VFDGDKPVPYTPLDQARPLGIYGQTKLQGEWAVRARAPRSLIVRVSWIFSEFGNNFVRTMLMLAQTRSSVTVVCDQVGAPHTHRRWQVGFWKWPVRLLSRGFRIGAYIMWRVGAKLIAPTWQGRFSNSAGVLAGRPQT
jgi:hypothetical protein